MGKRLDMGPIRSSLKRGVKTGQFRFQQNCLYNFFVLISKLCDNFPQSHLVLSHKPHPEAISSPKFLSARNWKCVRSATGRQPLGSEIEK